MDVSPSTRIGGFTLYRVTREGQVLFEGREDECRRYIEVRRERDRQEAERPRGVRPRRLRRRERRRASA